MHSRVGVSVAGSMRGDEDGMYVFPFCFPFYEALWHNVFSGVASCFASRGRLRRTVFP